MVDAGTPPELPPGLREEYLAGMRSQLGLLATIADRLTAAGNDREALAVLQRETHKIHGSAGSYGFAEASRLAAGLDATAKDWVARPTTPTGIAGQDRKSTRLNSSHTVISYAVF